MVPGQRARGWRRAGYALALVGTVAIGLAVKSDALRVGWLSAAVMICLMAWYSRPVFRRRRLLSYVSYVIVPVLLIAAAVTYGPELLAAFEQAAMDLYQQGDQGEERFTAGAMACALSPSRRWSAGVLGRFLAGVGRSRVMRPTIP